ncbi:MAG TPA: serine hydrolase [Pyrinomonadaceae bacterium]|nr:serine hydrolase [Pyrinomonadaceae bacterium]
MRFFLHILFIPILLVAQIIGLSQNLFAQVANGQTVSSGGSLSARLIAIEKAVEERRLALGIPGVSLAIVKDDKIIYSKGFGMRDIERKLPVTPDTLFAIGSATKAFTAVAVMMSADAGKLNLDDSPKKFLPFFKLSDPESDARVTLRDLLSHRTGLARTDLALSFAGGKLTREDLIRIAGVAKPTFKIGQKFQYQNVMYAAAGEIAGKVNNTTYENFITDRIFKPLGMKQTNFSIAGMQAAPDFSLGYDYNPETKTTKKLSMVDLSVIAPAGAINSSVREMSNWLRFLLGGGIFEGKRLVSENNINEVWTEQMKIAPGFGYGFGWFLRDWRGKKEVDHGGNIDGFNAMVAMLPEEHLGLVMLSNVTDSSFKDEVREIVYSNLLGQPDGNAVLSKGKTDEVVSSNSSTTDISPTLREIIGSYESERSGLPVEVSERSGAITMTLQGQPPRRLIEKSKDAFAVEGTPENFRLSVKRDENGKVNSLLYDQGGTIAPLRRVVVPPDAPTIDELNKKIVEALGGEINLRKHTSMRMEMAVDFENQGVTAESETIAKAPNKSAQNSTLIALGKKIGTISNYFDGANGGSLASVGTPFILSGRMLEDARIAADFYEPLDWKTLYRNVKIKKMSKVASEDVYVVEKIPEKGNSVTDYVSTKTFLVLRRDSMQPQGFGDNTIPKREVFSDYRPVDGVMMPFKIVSNDPDGGSITTTVKSIQFNVPAADALFKPTFAVGLSNSMNAAKNDSVQIPAANPADVASIDAIIAALYDVISGDAGKKRDWNRLRSLFTPDGKMIPLAPKREGGFAAHYLTVDAYVERSGAYVEANGFFERELARKTEQFGNLAHVFSTYEGKHKLSDEKPFLRGINSIQLMNDGTRWWIVNISWEAERPDSLLPEKYLPTKN